MEQSLKVGELEGAEEEVGRCKDTQAESWRQMGVGGLLGYSEFYQQR